MSHLIRPGVFAPTFNTVDMLGSPVALESYRGRKVLLSFFRNSACALCNLRIRQFIGRHAQWNDQGMDVIAVFTSEEKMQATMADFRTKAFIAEAAAAGFELIHEKDSNFHRVPAEFLINENGIVQAAHYGQLVTDHLDIAVIDRFAAGK
ncbi:peroxiredoxin family protein [Paenibacillus kobensis]|uniref:peroxiredoxin family protein n=1 Tax=Paenibacillus kobensis TaxID=59841 RepID=UPI0013E3460E|nr:redoxin domain-containing protein [Paenibacillus kobensis]